MENGNIQSVDIDEQMRSAYLDYAMSVIVARALPDARDGLKPVHRRILYAMNEMGIRSNTPYKKSARIVGEVLGKYHPHGDLAVYDAMARLAQDFSMRYMMVDGQGNFGSVDGDSPAAMRYTEARLSAMAEELLADYDKNTVDFLDNFDGSLQEPVVLPARLPNMLLNGSSGIAVGMATNIPPHNLRELVHGLNHIIDNYDNLDDVSVEDLMKFIPGPDFPTGGIIVGREGILQAYSTGRGRLVMRGLAHIEEIKGNRHAIYVTELPYQVNKANLIERIAEIAKEGRLPDISDLRDESDRNGISIYIELKRGAQPQRVLNKLYKYTALQSTFGVQTLALLNNEPRLFPLKKALQTFIEHRQVVITRRSEFELEKARRRAHILDGLLIALSNLDEVIQTIRQSPDAEEAKKRLIQRFGLTDIQAQAILDMQLRRLAALERQKIEDEHRQVLELIASLENLLANPRKILDVIKEDLQQLDDKYGDDRRTRIMADATENFEEADLVSDEPTLITITERGYIKRVAPSTYRTRMRGRRGVSGQNVKDEDEIIMMLMARTLNTVLFFTNQGKVYSEKVYQIPDANRTDRGIPVINLLAMNADERVTAAVVVPDFNNVEYLTMATVKGRVKRVEISEFSSVRNAGLIAINLEKGDQLGWVSMTSGKDNVILVTTKGYAVRFPEDQIRTMGRNTMGVTGIRLRAADQLTSMEVVEPGGSLLIVSENGYGKRTPLEDYPVKSRATSGVLTTDKKGLGKVGKIATARVVQDQDEITLISKNGLVLRLKVEDINISGRATRGTHIIDLQKGDSLAALARIPATSIILETAGEPGQEPGVKPAE